MKILTDIKGHRYYIDSEQGNRLYEIGDILNNNKIINYAQIVRKSSKSGNDIKSIGYLVECVIDGCQFVTVQADLKKVHGCPICKDKHKYNIGDIINNTKILKQYKINNIKYYTCECMIDGYVFEVKESSIKKKSHRCPLCHGVLIPGVNDVETLRPDLLIYFKNKEEARQITPFSNRTEIFVCPVCKKEKKMKMESLSIQGFSCNCCGDNISIPNKFMYFY